MALTLSNVDALTAFLGLTEMEINSGKSPLEDYFNFLQREYFPEANVTVLAYHTGDFVEAVMDHDSGNRCINQKTFSQNIETMKNHILPDKTNIETFFNQKGYWPEVYVPRLKKKIKFSVQWGLNGEFIQTDIWLD